MKFRKILQKYIINNIGYKILAVVFSFLLWLVILNITDPEYTRTLSNIPVQIRNERLVLDGDHVYTIASGDVTNVIVTGKRSIISTLTVNDFVISADFEELSITNAVPIKVELRSEKARYSSQISMTTTDTSMIINLEEMDSVQLPVTLEYRGSLPENIVIEEANPSPKKVVLQAPQSVTESAKDAVVYVDQSLITEDMEMFLTPEIRTLDGAPLKPGTDSSLDTEGILVEFRTSAKKNVPISVHYHGEPAAGYVLTNVELSQDTIAVKGPVDILDGLGSIELPPELLDLTGADGPISMEVDITPWLPEGVVVYGESSMFTVTADVMSREEATALTEEP